MVMSNSKDCDLKLCKDVNEYINNFDECRGTAGVYRYLTVGLSVIPLTGIGNVYSGNTFDAVFELLEGMVALVAICAFCGYCADDMPNDCHPALVCESICSFLLVIINVVRYAICQASADSFMLYEFSLLTTTTIITFVFSCCGCCAEKRCFIVLFINVIVVIVMEVIRDIYNASYNENDWNGCPFI